MTALQEQINEIAHRFAHHPPGSPVVAQTHQEIRTMLGDVAVKLAHLTGRSREQSLALTALEEAMFWANASVARHHPDNQASGFPGRGPGG